MTSPTFAGRQHFRASMHWQFAAIVFAAVTPAAAAITIENASQSTVTCRIALPDQAAPRDVAIAPGKSESLDAEQPVECQFRSSGREVRYSLQPGRQYRFLLSTAGRLELRSLTTTTANANSPLTPPSPARLSSPKSARGESSKSAARSTPSRPALPQPAGQARRWPQVRDVKVVVAGGKEYRAFYRDKWQNRARGIVEAAAARFEEQFPIHFRIVGYRAWEYRIAPESAGDAFEWLHKVDRGEADLVIGFTLVPFPGPRGEIRGITQYFSQCVVIPDCWGTTGATTRLVHELCHVFGAFHVAATDSVMQLGFERTPKTFRFGEPAERIIELTKGVDLDVGVDSLSPETQEKIREIYRAHHHPIESVDEDPIVVGYRYQARRSDWAGDAERSGRMQAIADRLSPPDAAPSPADEGVQVHRTGEMMSAK